jgi:hypothetical protein
MAKPEGEYAKVQRGAEVAERGLGVKKEGAVPLTSPLVSAGCGLFFAPSCLHGVGGRVPESGGGSHLPLPRSSGGGGRVFEVGGGLWFGIYRSINATARPPDPLRRSKTPATSPAGAGEGKAGAREEKASGSQAQVCGPFGP